MRPTRIIQNKVATFTFRNFSFAILINILLVINNMYIRPGPIVAAPYPLFQIHKHSCCLIRKSKRSSCSIYHLMLHLV